MNVLLTDQCVFCLTYTLKPMDNLAIRIFLLQSPLSGVRFSPGSSASTRTLNRCLNFVYEICHEIL